MSIGKTTLILKKGVSKEEHELIIEKMKSLKEKVWKKRKLILGNKIIILNMLDTRN